MNKQMKLKTLLDYGIEFETFLNTATINNFISYKGLIDFCKEQKKNLKDYFTFTLNNQLYKVDIKEDGLYLSNYRTSYRRKPINKFFVRFSDYQDENDSFPSPEIVEENYKNRRN